MRIDCEAGDGVQVGHGGAHATAARLTTLSGNVVETNAPVLMTRDGKGERLVDGECVDSAGTPTGGREGYGVYKEK